MHADVDRKSEHLEWTEGGHFSIASLARYFTLPSHWQEYNQLSEPFIRSPLMRGRMGMPVMLVGPL